MKLTQAFKPVQAKLSRLMTGLIMMYTGFSASNLKTARIQLKEGFKHVFGMTQRQIDAALVAKYLVGVSESRRPAYKQLMENHINTVRQNAAFGVDTTKAFMGFDKLDVIRSVLDNSAYLDLVGVQPMVAPVGLGYELTMGTTNVPNQVRLEIKNRAVETGTRKLQARFNVESKQDIAAMAGSEFDMHQVFAQVLGHEVGGEIDAEVVHKLLKVASDAQADAVTINWADPSRASQQVELAINQAANRVAQDTRRGAGNWAIVSPKVLALLQSSKNFVGIKGGAASTYLSYQGILNGCIVIYMSPYFGGDELPHVLVGYKGPGEIDSGYYHMPYVTLMSSGVVIDPATFEPQISLMTRYGGFYNTNSEGYYKKVNLAFVMEMPNVSN